MRPKDWFKKVSGFDFLYSSNIQLKVIFSFFIHVFSPKVNMNAYIYIVYINDIAICYFKQPLPYMIKIWLVNFPR